MTVLEEVVKMNRPPVLFIGSGIPKRYLYKYPSWQELLEMSFAKFEQDPFQYKNILIAVREKICQILKLIYIWGVLLKMSLIMLFLTEK